MFTFRYFDFLRPRMWPTTVTWEQDCGWDGRHRWGLALAGGCAGRAPLNQSWHLIFFSISFAISNLRFRLGLVYPTWPAERGLCLWCWGDSLLFSPGLPDNRCWSYLWRLHHHKELGPISCTLFPQVRKKWQKNQQVNSKVSIHRHSAFFVSADSFYWNSWQQLLQFCEIPSGKSMFFKAEYD